MLVTGATAPSQRLRRFGGNGCGVRFWRGRRPVVARGGAVDLLRR